MLFRATTLSNIDKISAAGSPCGSSSGRVPPPGREVPSPPLRRRATRPQAVQKRKCAAGIEVLSNIDPSCSNWPRPAPKRYQPPQRHAGPHLQRRVELRSFTSLSSCRHRTKTSRRAMKTLPSSPARSRCRRRPRRPTLVTTGHRVVACFGLVGLARSTVRQVSESVDPQRLGPSSPCNTAASTRDQRRLASCPSSSSTDDAHLPTVGLAPFSSSCCSCSRPPRRKNTRRNPGRRSSLEPGHAAVSASIVAAHSAGVPPPAAYVAAERRASFGRDVDLRRGHEGGALRACRHVSSARIA